MAASSRQRRVGALPAVNDPHAESIWAFVSRSTSAYTLVVSIETCPSHARIVLMSTPARRRCVAVVWRLCRRRHRYHYLPFLTMSSDIGRRSRSI
jgi:hypothetical protein